MPTIAATFALAQATDAWATADLAAGGGYLPLRLRGAGATGKSVRHAGGTTQGSGFEAAQGSKDVSRRRPGTVIRAHVDPPNYAVRVYDEYCGQR